MLRSQFIITDYYVEIFPLRVQYRLSHFVKILPEALIFEGRLKSILTEWNDKIYILS